MVDAWLLQERSLGNMEVGLWGIANISSNNRVFALLLSQMKPSSHCVCLVLLLQGYVGKLIGLPSGNTQKCLTIPDATASLMLHT